MGIRRVVTGHTKDRKTTIASDSTVDGETAAPFPGFEQHTIWGADGPPTLPNDGSMAPFANYFPPLGGFRFTVVTFAPESSTKLTYVDPEAVRSELETIWPGLVATQDPDNPRMHASATTDFIYVIAGDISLELGDGQEVHLSAGDTLIQNGTRHAWHNKSKMPCRMVVCLVGANQQPASAS